MLLIITVLGLSSVQTTTLQERMARNARDSNLAFLAAESALKDAEAMIETFDTVDDSFGIDWYVAKPTIKIKASVSKTVRQRSTHASIS